MLYATPVEAEEAFYDAFSRCDLETMMQVWHTDVSITCIHPAGPRIQGIDAIRQSWRQIFASGEHLNFHIIRHQCTQASNLAIHLISEQIRSGDDSTTLAEVFTTNIYELTADGWRMTLHHASPARAIASTRNTTMH